MEINRKSHILDLLEPGDEVMADKRFTIEDLLTNVGASLVIPPFKRGVQFSKGTVTNYRPLNGGQRIDNINVDMVLVFVNQSVVPIMSLIEQALEDSVSSNVTDLNGVANIVAGNYNTIAA
ncbi:hypothetical protein NHX12_018368, partial [Muraenolepis orangiensis]